MALSIVVLLTAESVNAQSIAKPSAPEFTAKLISPPEGSQIVYRTIELTITNQPSVSFYNVRMKVNDGDWSLLYPNNNSVPAQSNGEATTLSYNSGFLGVENQYGFGYTAQNLSAGDRADFQVQAMVGSIHRVYNPNHTSQLDMYPYVFTGEVSEWSNTQTVTIPDGSGSTDPTLTVAPTSESGNPFSPTALAAVIVVAVLATVVFLLVYVRKIKNQLPKQ